MNSKVSIAILGCGRISKNHLKAILIKNDRCFLSALCDTSKERLNDTLDYFEEVKNSEKVICDDPILFEDFSELLANVLNKKIKVDLLIIATPSGLHSSQTILAAKAGIAVCTEKPMATTFEDGLKMIKTCKSEKVKLFVVKQNRFNQTLQLLKKQIEKGRFGQLSLITVNVFWHRPQSYYDNDSWRGTLKLDGGALMNQASHYVDLLDWLIGPVESLSASVATLGREIEAEDTASIQLKWKNGALGTMAVTMLTYPRNLEGSITILGEKGTVKIGGVAVNEIKHWEFSSVEDDDNLLDEVSYQTTSVYGFGHSTYYDNMLDVLDGKAQPICDGDQGLRSLELITAAYRSSKETKTIYLPLKK